MMSTFAFAEETSTSSITISNAVEGQTYTAYQLFSQEKVEGNDNVYYTMTTEQYNFWHTTLESNGFTINSGSVENAGKYIVTKIPDLKGNDSTELKTLTTALANKYESETTKPAAAGSVTAASNSATISGLSTGYYFVNTSLGTVCALVHDGSEYTAIEKNGTPNITKTANKDTVKIGDVIDYTITLTTAGNNRETYTLHDKMSPSLTLDTDSFQVTSGGNSVNSSYYTLITNKSELTDGCTFEIKFNDDYTASLENNTVIVVTYSAEVTSGAEDGILVNEATMEFGQSSIPVESKVYMGGVIVDKYAYNKLDTTDKTTKLADAWFVIKNSQNKYLAEQTDGKYIWVDSWGESSGKDDSKPLLMSKVPEAGSSEIGWNIVVMKTDTNGYAKVLGLECGNYSLVEIKSPTGYNKAQDEFAFTVSGTTSNTLIATTSVANNTGTTLPETGGIGTTIFYLLGAILVVGAGVVFVTRRRMHSDK